MPTSYFLLKFILSYSGQKLYSNDRKVLEFGLRVDSLVDILLFWAILITGIWDTFFARIGRLKVKGTIVFIFILFIAVIEFR